MAETPNREFPPLEAIRDEIARLERWHFYGDLFPAKEPYWWRDTPEGILRLSPGVHPVPATEEEARKLPEGWRLHVEVSTSVGHTTAKGTATNGEIEIAFRVSMNTRDDWAHAALYMKLLVLRVTGGVK